MTGELGQLALCFALALALVMTVAGLLGTRPDAAAARRVATSSAMGMLVFVGLAFAVAASANLPVILYSLYCQILSKTFKLITDIRVILLFLPLLPSLSLFLPYIFTQRHVTTQNQPHTKKIARAMITGQFPFPNPN